MAKLSIRVGDEVMWRGAWGSQPPRKVKVLRMELCEYERQKYGVEVEEALLKDKDRLCIDLSSGNWAYGFQIQPL